MSLMTVLPQLNEKKLFNTYFLQIKISLCSGYPLMFNTKRFSVKN